jgi:hypothetical protein
MTAPSKEVPALLTVVNPHSALGSAGDELSQVTESPGTTFMTWNLLHLARMLKDAGGLPAHGSQRTEWDAGCRFDFPNPEHR